MELREYIIQHMDSMTDEELTELLAHIEHIRTRKAPQGYDVDSDPAIGLIQEKVNFDASDSKRILREDITPHSGWTQKKG